MKIYITTEYTGNNIYSNFMWFSLKRPVSVKPWYRKIKLISINDSVEDYWDGYFKLRDFKRVNVGVYEKL